MAEPITREEKMGTRNEDLEDSLDVWAEKRGLRMAEEQIKQEMLGWLNGIGNRLSLTSEDDEMIEALRSLLLEPDPQGASRSKERIEILTPEEKKVDAIYGKKDARKITAKVRQELGITEEEFDAITYDLLSGVVKCNRCGNETLYQEAVSQNDYEQVIDTLLRLLHASGESVLTVAAVVRGLSVEQKNIVLKGLVDLGKHDKRLLKELNEEVKSGD